jgi:hypothetical protein
MQFSLFEYELNLRQTFVVQRKFSDFFYLERFLHADCLSLIRPSSAGRRFGAALQSTRCAYLSRRLSFQNKISGFGEPVAASGDPPAGRAVARPPHIYATGVRIPCSARTETL